MLHLYKPSAIYHISKIGTSVPLGVRCVRRMFSESRFSALGCPVGGRCRRRLDLRPATSFPVPLRGGARRRKYALLFSSPAGVHLVVVGRLSTPRWGKPKDRRLFLCVMAVSLLERRNPLRKASKIPGPLLPRTALGKATRMPGPTFAEQCYD